MNISGKIEIGKKNKYGKFSSRKINEGITFTGRKTLTSGKDTEEKSYEELSGINDFDTSILDANAIASEPLRLEIKLAVSEKKLEKIKKERKINKTLGIEDLPSNKKLQDAEKKVKTEITSYRKQYRELGITYKIADICNQAELFVNNTITGLTESAANLGIIKKILSKIPNYKEKEQYKKSKLLAKKIESEVSRQGRYEVEEFEYLLVKAEKITRNKNNNL